MPDNEITLNPEEAAALWEAFKQDYDIRADRVNSHEYLNRDVLKHALALAVSRERERCAKIGENPRLLNRDKGEKIRSGE